MIRALDNVETAAGRSQANGCVRAPRSGDGHATFVRAEHEMARVAGRPARVDKRRSGRHVRARLAAPTRRGAATAARRREGMVVAVAVGPLIVSATGHAQIQRVVAGSRTPGVAGRPVHGDRELSGSGERDAERIAKSIRPDGVRGPERVIRGNGPVRVVAEHLAAYVAHVLCARRIVLVAQGHIQLAVRPEGDASTLMAAVIAGGEW